MLTGGSAFGLDAAAGVMRWMDERKRGHPMGDFVVPIVPAAVIFDLLPLGRTDARPTPEMAYAACETATSIGIAEGSVGAGTGATVGKVGGREGAMKGGVGCWFEQVDELMVAAVAVVNAFGDVRDAQGNIIAGARLPDGTFADSARILANGPPSFPARPATTTEAAGERVSTEPFTSRRDAFVASMRARLDAMDKALDNVKASGPLKTEVEDVRARAKKLGDDVDRLNSASPDDWWDVTKARVTEYVDRIEGSVKRLDDRG